jgi:ubiquinone biosynthesis protein
MGQVIAGIATATSTLVESIRKFPDQETLRGHDPRRGLRTRGLSQPEFGDRGAAFRLEDLDGEGPPQHLAAVRTGATFERTGAMGAVLEAMDAPPTIRVAARVLGWPFKWLGLRGDPAMPPVPRALTALGPAYIKFGQILSTRPDVVGDRLALELQVLQDKLPPFPGMWPSADRDRDGKTAARAVHGVLGTGRRRLHRAGAQGPPDAADREVAVKVLRPGVERAFRKDIDAFYLIAWVIETLSPASRRLRPRDVIEHFEGVVMQELDLRIESSAAGEFAANTEGDAGFAVPPVEWYLSSRG